jgi:serine/threonine protein kinase
MKVLSDVALGLSFVHDVGYCHRDVKPENIFIRRTMEEQFDVVLGDFGLAARPTDTEGFGTARWMPRAAHRRRSTMSGDYESLFFVSVFLWTGRPLPWISVRLVLRLKDAAFADLETFYVNRNSGAVPEHVRQLGLAVRLEGDVVFNDIRQMLSGHGIQGPINFDAPLQVKKRIRI